MTDIQTAQRQYISEWHDNFVNHIGGLMGIVEVMMNHPSATDEDKKGFEQVKMLLNGKDAKEVERRLAEADIQQDLLDKIEKLYKDLVDLAIEHIQTDVLVNEFLKALSYYQIEQSKRFAGIRLGDLQILKK